MMEEHKGEKAGSNSGCCWVRHKQRMDQGIKPGVGVGLCVCAVSQQGSSGNAGSVCSMEA